MKKEINDMNVYYNEKGIGDVLIVTLTPIDKTERDYEEYGNVVRLIDKNTGKTVGYNIFKASDYVSVTGNGLLELSTELIDSVNDILRKNGVNEELSQDITPKFVVGLVKTKEKHPDADKLSVCKVNVGEKVLQIVCGAPNVAEGQKVVTALVGAVMPSGLVIKDAQLRGVDSSGMICSAKELNLPNAPQEKGILVLEDNYEIGADFFKQYNNH
jgi:tRNA-binding protein